MTYTESLELNQFVLKLNLEQKIIFLKALAFLSNIDGVVAEEIMYIKDAAEKFGIQQPAQIFKPVPEAEILKEIKKLNNRRVCLELIKELFILGHSDSDLTDNETLFIGHAGQIMGIELEKIEQIGNWVIDKIIWLEQGKIIFEDN